MDIRFHIRRADTGPENRRANDAGRCAQLHSALIDRHFPLWEFHIFDRIQLQDGKIVGGFFSNIHHATLDGKGGVMLANAMLDFTPVPRDVTPPDPARRRKLEGDLKLGKMIDTVFSSSLSQLAKAARMLPSAASALTTSLSGSLARQAVGSVAGARAGMPAPLYPAGARFLSFYPLSIVVHRLALNITIQTYAGRVDFGIVADNKALPHANDLARVIEAAFKEGHALMSPAAFAPTATPPVKTRTPRVPQATKSVKAIRA